MGSMITDACVAQYFKKSAKNGNLIGTNEGVNIEYKESFGWKSLSDYFKTMAAYANREGGYIIFGIKDKPHEFVGLNGSALKNFESIDNQVWSTNLREHFSPEINWEKRSYVFEDRTYGILYTYPAKEKPVICKKDAGELRKAAIYYRYNSQNSEIDYPELHAIIENEMDKINARWMEVIKKIGNIGAERVALLDLTSGEMTGANATLYVDENILNQIAFVREGSFVETGGNPALKVVGEVQTIVGAQKVIVNRDVDRGINVDEIIKGFITQEDVNNPTEFIRQICYQTSGNIPVYYYMSKAQMSVKETISFLEAVPTNTQAKSTLLRRLTTLATKHKKIATAKTEVFEKKQSYVKGLTTDSAEIPSNEKDFNYFFIALQSLSKEDVMAHKDYILNVLYKIYITYYNDTSFARIKNGFRYALCWVDEALYMPESDG